MSKILVALLLILIQVATAVEDSSGNEEYTGASGSGQSAYNVSSSSNAWSNTTNHSDNNFHYKLTNLHSNGLINFTANVMLASIVQLVGLENITIIGHDNPTVNCYNAGGIHFDNCHNCMVIGITWEKCGINNYSMPAMEIYNSSNIIIRNCSFHNSVAQAITLSEMSGNATINHCKFLYNNHFVGHGTTIHFLSKFKHPSKFKFTISNCNFTQNGATIDNSIVYIGPSNNKPLEQIYLTDCVFSSNQGVPIYVSHQNVFVTGIMIFEGNMGTSGGGMFITNHSYVMLKSDTKFINNTVLLDGGAFSIQSSNIMFKGNSTITVDSNQAIRYGGALYIGSNSNAIFEENSTILIINTQAGHGGAVFTTQNSNVTFTGNCTVMIDKSQVTGYGGAIFINNSFITFEGNSRITISNNQALYGGAFFIWVNSYVAFKGLSIVTIINNQVMYSGGALYIWKNCNFTIEVNSIVKISNNQAMNDGGAILISENCNVTIAANSIVMINNNKASYGGGIFIYNMSYGIFEGNSTVIVNNNQADQFGGALYVREKSNITIKGNTTVTANYNQASFGGGFSIRDFSDVTFKENCTIAINYNKAKHDGGGIVMYYKSNIMFEGNSTVTMNNNQVRRHGGAIYFWDMGNAIFKGASTVTINDNHASSDGGALYINIQSITFEERSTVTFNNNQAMQNGGALYIRVNVEVTITENSAVVINNSQANFGGALYIYDKSSITLKGKSVINFYANTAKISGGALCFIRHCTLLFEDDSFAAFHHNTANADGGALYTQENCDVIIRGASKLMFNNNEALDDGGAVYISSGSSITFQDDTTVKFNENKAAYFGGALRSKFDSDILFENNSTITFDLNVASLGGAIFTLSNIEFKDYSVVEFYNNKVTGLGGALHISDVVFKDNTMVIFKNNEAELNGGALCTENSNIIVQENSTVAFITNSAENGGALFAYSAILLVSGYSNVTFYKNNAAQDGGAIYFNDQISANFNNTSTVTLISNTAINRGGAIYSKITPNTKYFNISEIKFSSDNRAIVAGSLLYIELSKSCNSSCLNDRILGISNETLYQDVSDERVATSPATLKLHDTAKCISNNMAGCDKYYIDNVMLGEEITIYPCLLDYYNKPAEVTQFSITGENHKNYFLQGSQYKSISCNHTIEGISVVGNKIISTLPLNYSVNFTSYSTHKSEKKIISVNLTVKLTPCHPGFQYHRKSQKCECYNASGIVFCSRSGSVIKRGYWFGHVTGISTITFCPINYCNFTCCKTTNGYYHLSPVRANQCTPHRSGTACGSCEKDYTLSFDSAECISIDKCSTGLIILVVTLTVLYWFVVMVAVFIMMYYQVGIGYFYAITYYYSVVDVILNQHTDLSNSLYITVTIISSIAKITPRFLGQLCLFRDMSGIDQQFIHYIHPLGVLLILIVISLLARHSRRLSMLISRGIINAICFLLLLSYTSVATTSLLLMRSLTFVDVDNVYTYLSPDIQYFHGRHLAYGITAIILTLLIVLGLPLLLLLEPFLNRKINFFRIKPLLDQFQGCYKDRYRWFAAYYMVCRLIIIIIFIINFSDAFISWYLLIIFSTVIALIQVTVKPYADNILNMFDGAVLHLMVLVTVLPLSRYFDTFDSNLAVGIAFVLLILPLLLFVMMKIFTSKQSLKNITKKYFFSKESTLKSISNPSSTIVKNHDMRKNVSATVIDMHM